jgi:N6-adenosine-specific RNA methylase IME4
LNLLAGGPGFEPRLTESESDNPLDLAELFVKPHARAGKTAQILRGNSQTAGEGAPRPRPGPAAELPALYASVRRDLAKLVKIDEVKDIIDKSIAAQVYAIQAKDPDLAAHVSEFQERAKTRLGELIAELREAGKLARGGAEPGVGRRGNNAGCQETRIASQTLDDMGIDKNLAHRARKLAAMSEPEREETIARSVALAVAAASGSAAVISAARAERYVERSKVRRAREKHMALAMPTGKYGVILADPEWDFKFWSDKAMTHSAAQMHYETSPLDVIKARDVPSIAADDCALFLWATVPMLPQALEVMAAWGFAYKSNFVWVKDKIGTGYWNRNQHELLLVGTRGKIPAPADGHQWASAISAPRGAHSEKPDKTYELIEAYFPNLPKIELNARKRRAGWAAWGFEAPEAAE